MAPRSTTCSPASPAPMSLAATESIASPATADPAAAPVMTSPDTAGPVAMNLTAAAPAATCPARRASGPDGVAPPRRGGRVQRTDCPHQPGPARRRTRRVAAGRRAGARWGTRCPGPGRIVAPRAARPSRWASARGTDACLPHRCRTGSRPAGGRPGGPLRSGQSLRPAERGRSVRAAEPAAPAWPAASVRSVRPGWRRRIRRLRCLALPGRATIRSAGGPADALQPAGSARLGRAPGRRRRGGRGLAPRSVGTRYPLGAGYVLRARCWWGSGCRRGPGDPALAGAATCAAGGSPGPAGLRPAARPSLAPLQRWASGGRGRHVLGLPHGDRAR